VDLCDGGLVRRMRHRVDTRQFALATA
jgi:hypothetical protein